MQHLDEGTIHAWLDGALSGDEHMLIEQHTRECRDCAALVADARGMIAGASRIVSALDSVPGAVIPAKRPVASAKAQTNLWRSLRLTPFRAGLAATLMIAAASMFAVRRGTIDNITAPAAQSRLDDRPPPPVAMPLAAAPAPAVAAIGRAPATNERAKDARKASTAAAVVAAAPPPSANVARDEVARTDIAKAKAASPIAQPPEATNDARVSAVREKLDSASPSFRMADTARIARGALGGASAFAQTSQPKSLQLMEVVTTSATDATSQAAPLFFGCYRVDRDSLSPLSSLPERFALDREGAAPAVRYVVRSVRANGEVDTVLTNASWQSTRRGAATVTWTVAAKSVVLRMGIASPGMIVATATVDNVVRSIQLNRTACSR